MDRPPEIATSIIHPHGSLDIYVLAALEMIISHREKRRGSPKGTATTTLSQDRLFPHA